MAPEIGADKGREIVLHEREYEKPPRMMVDPMKNLCGPIQLAYMYRFP